MVVAETDGDLVGTATVVYLGDAAILRAVAVRDALRGAGVGTLVVAAAARAASAHGARLLVAFTETAEPFFVHLGFRKVGRHALPEDVRASEQATGECSTATPLAFDLG